MKLTITREEIERLHATWAEAYELEVTEEGWVLSGLVRSKSNDWMVAETELEAKHDDIIGGVCEAVGIKWSQVKTRSHSRRVTIARYIIASELYYAGETLETVGVILNRDHSTVYYGIKCARNPFDVEMANFYDKYLRLKNKSEK